MFAPESLLGSPVIVMKVMVNERQLSRDGQIFRAIEGVRRITGVDLHWRCPMPEDQRIDMILFEFARFEMNVMVAELNVLMTIVLTIVTEKAAADNARKAVNVMVAELNEFVTTVKSNPQSNATVILRLATAALRRVVLPYSHEMQFGKETLFMELSQFVVSAGDFDLYINFL